MTILMGLSIISLFILLALSSKFKQCMSLFTKRIKHKENHYLAVIPPIMIALTFSILFIGCSDGKSTLSYKAIDKKDTAVLSLNVHAKYFFGDCKISYGGSVINSGKIKGDVKGDTLIVSL